MNKTDNHNRWEQPPAKSRKTQQKAQLPASELKLDEALRDTAPLNFCTEPPANLHESIMHAVHKSKAARRTHIFPIITSIAASLMIISYISINTRNRTQQQAVDQITKTISDFDSQINGAVSKVPVMLDAPMQQEIDAFKDDVQNATAYLLACIE
jgi:hypothetical protein